MTNVLTTSIALLWVLFCFAVLGMCAPLAALGAGSSRRALVLHIGPALVCTWLTLAVGVPLAAALGGFNWVTAIVLAAACPAGMWLHRHRHEPKAVFLSTIQSVVMDIVTLRIVHPRIGGRSWRAAAAGALLLLLWVVVTAGRDIRLPVPADFDTLWRTRQLLSGTAVWDPLAALAAVLTRISAANPLHVASAIRVALVALTGVAAAMLVAELAGWSWTPALIVPLALPLVAPAVPVAAWAIALSILTAATSFLTWRRTGRPRERFYALAALALAAGQMQPFAGNLNRLKQVGSTAQYLEHPAAVTQALQLDRTVSDVDWVLVGPPEQQLEIERGRFLDLARFVSRFRGRAGDPNFRFDLGVQRIYVFVEAQPAGARVTAADGEFIAAQPVSYRVPRERFRLAQLARQICDDYRRTHPGAVLTYDDGALRVYQIDR